MTRKPVTVHQTVSMKTAVEDCPPRPALWCAGDLGVIQHEAGTILARGMVPTTPEGFARMRDEHHVPPGTRVALETGTSAFYVARLLAALHLEPVVVDAHEVRRKASRPSQKSDRRDALEICDGDRRDYYRAVVHIPSPAISMLRTTLSRRRHFIRIQTAEVNAAKRLLRGVGWPGGTRMTLRSATSWDRLVAALVTAPDPQPHVRGHYAVWQQAGAQVRATDHLLGEHSLRPRRCTARLGMTYWLEKAEARLRPLGPSASGAEAGQ